MDAMMHFAGPAAAGGWHQYDRWDLFALSLVFHIAVLGLFIAGTVIPRRKVANLPNGALLAFLVALFAEMYGLPLTVYLLQPLLPFGELFYPVPLVVRLGGSALMLAGFLLVFVGWRLIFRSGGEVVESGIYAHVRHPQYLGLTVLTLGQLIEWPTLTGMILWPLVVLLYVRLARKEDAEVAARFGRPALAYQARVPAFFPRRARPEEAAEGAGAPRRAARAAKPDRRGPTSLARTRRSGDARGSSVSGGQAAGDRRPGRLPREMKLIGGLVLFVVSFFASTITVLVSFQLLEVAPSPGHRTLGLTLIVCVGVAFFGIGLYLLRRHGDALLELFSGRLEGVVGRMAPAATSDVRGSGAGARPRRPAARATVQGGGRAASPGSGAPRTARGKRSVRRAKGTS